MRAVFRPTKKPYPMNDNATNTPVSIYEFAAKGIDGTSVAFEQYRGKVLLIVNVASRCGFTPQYKQLQELYDAYRDRGLVILGFPCNQFGFQEPGSDTEIRDFCSLNYNVSFPMFAKIAVNGSDADPIYEFLKHSAPGLLGTEGIKWNFTKFLVDRAGKVVERYAPSVAPNSMIEAIEALL